MTATEQRFVHDDGNVLDPLGDAEKEAEKGTKYNRAKVGSGRPSSLIYTYGPGSIMDLPQFTIMPSGLDDWDRIWARREHIPQIRAPRLREAVRLLLRSPDVQLRPFPWQAKKFSMSAEGTDLGVPARVFPQWLRCTGCDLLARVAQFDYHNTHPYRTDLAYCELVDQIRGALGDKLAKYHDQLEMVRDLLDGKVDVTALSDAELADAVAAGLAPPPSTEEHEQLVRDWDPVDLLVPEWTYLQTDPLGPMHDDVSGLTLSKQPVDPELRPQISRVLAVERLRKVNALVGFTRIDDVDRVGDLPRRLAPLTRSAHPAWTVATEDRGEGIFIQLDAESVQEWEDRVERTDLWRAHRDANRRNFARRFSETAEDVDPDTWLKLARYWLVHTLAHVLIREMAMTCGYSAASLSERLYAWPAAEGRPAAAGLLICTTASDSDGTLGGLVQLSDPDRLQRVVSGALYRATRCSSDPICAMRSPRGPEDFLHGAACHCCVMASETSCERANRFLDRRFLIDLPGSNLGYFGRVD